MTNDLSAAWRNFEHNDVRPVDLLCLRWMDIDNGEFVALQQDAAAGEPAGRRRAAEALLALVGAAPTPELFDGVLPSVAHDLGDREEAIALRLRALALTPRWHPGVAARVVGNIGWQLQEYGRYDEAVAWFHRALAFDPLNPFVLESLAEIAAASGEPYVPAKVELLELSARDWGRLVATCLADEDTPIWRRLRALALGAAMRSELGMAQLYIAEAQQCIDEDEDDEITEVERKWIRATSEWLAAQGVDAEPDDGGTRGEELDALHAAGDRDRLRKFICDPIAALRVMAAEIVDGEEGRAYLEELDAMERKCGDAAAPLDAWRASTALYRLRTKARPRTAPRAIPPDLRPTTSAKLGKREGIVMWATFPDRITPEQGTWFDETLRLAMADVAREDPKAQIFAGDNLQTIEIIVRDARRPDLVMQALGMHFGSTDSPLLDVVLGRFEVPDGKRRHLFSATPDPEAKERDLDLDEAWDAAFDPSAAPPLTEPEDGPSMIMIPGPEGHVPEVRLAPIRFDDVRIVYGLADVEPRDRDDRDEAFDAALRDALDDVFRGQPPERFNREGTVDGPADAIAHRGRHGYAFAISGLCPELVVHYPRCFRFREHELLSALRVVTKRLELAPVVQWERGEGTWIFNLWR